MKSKSRAVEFIGLPRTSKFYHEDIRATECSARVVRRSGNLVALDRTIFYAESGGQVADHGSIQGCRVVDVAKVGGRPYGLPNGEVINVDTVFVHVLDERSPYEDLVEGQEVTCELDWGRRFRNMQMHTLAHLLFAEVGKVLERRGDPLRTLGCLIDSDRSRFDFANTIAPDDVSVVEHAMRRLLATGGVATVTPMEGADDAFLWRLRDIEIPCGGTHVNDLSEIRGEIEVSRRTKGRGKTRMKVRLDRSGEADRGSGNRN